MFSDHQLALAQLYNNSIIIAALAETKPFKRLCFDFFLNQIF